MLSHSSLAIFSHLCDSSDMRSFCTTSNRSFFSLSLTFVENTYNLMATPCGGVSNPYIIFLLDSQKLCVLHVHRTHTVLCTREKEKDRTIYMYNVQPEMLVRLLALEKWITESSSTRPPPTTTTITTTTTTNNQSVWIFI